MISKCHIEIRVALSSTNATKIENKKQKGIDTGKPAGISDAMFPLPFPPANV